MPLAPQDSFQVFIYWPPSIFSADIWNPVKSGTDDNVKSNDNWGKLFSNFAVGILVQWKPLAHGTQGQMFVCFYLNSGSNTPFSLKMGEEQCCPYLSTGNANAAIRGQRFEQQVCRALLPVLEQILQWLILVRCFQCWYKPSLKMISLLSLLLFSLPLGTPVCSKAL